MEEETVKRLGLILSIQAAIEGMKAENMQREILGQSIAYSSADFFDAAEKLLNVVNCPQEKLDQLL